MFTFIVLSWVPFRLRSLDDIVACYRIMFSFSYGDLAPLGFLVRLGVAVAIAVAVKTTSNEIRWLALRPLGAAALGVLAFEALSYLHLSKRFLYFQF